MPRLFGTDGVRGKANAELTPELAYKLGRAATIYFGREAQSTSKSAPTVLIGRDTRVSGEMLEAALIAGICSAGGRAIVAGVIPTLRLRLLISRVNLRPKLELSFPPHTIHFMTTVSNFSVEMVTNCRTLLRTRLKK